jgi:hypothetical protein
MLLQRTPVVRAVAAAGEFAAAAPVGAVLHAALAAVAALGAVDSLAGATTQLNAVPSSPASATVGQSFSMGMYVTGTGVTFAQSWDVTNSLPPGITPSGASLQGNQWLINSSGGTLTLAGTPTTAGTYTATVRGYEFTNRTGSVTSGTISIVVASAVPVFSTQPQDQTVSIGATVTFLVAVNLTPAPTYQWFKNGTAVPSAIGNSLTLANVQLADAGVYSVVATNTSGSYPSNGATLTVLGTAPTITAQPQSRTVTAGTAVTLSVTATGTPAPTYQWRKGGAAVAGATNSTLTFSSVQTADAGSYTVVVTNSAGSVASAAAVLTVNEAAPTIAVHPAGHTVAVGSTVALDFRGTGNALTYQWRKDGTPVSGATAARLVLVNALAGDAGNYTVTVTNAGGSVTSNAAALGVVSSADPGRIVNLSIRGTSGTGNKVLIMGFVTGGDGTGGNTSLLIRGAGPSIIPAPYYVTDALTDPAIQVIPAGSSAAFASNDNWGGTAQLQAAATATGAFPFVSETSKDAALVGDFPRNLYSVIVSGSNAATGSVLAEIYDANLGSPFNAATPRLVNLSARAYVGGTDTLTAGFVIVGATAKTVLVRAVGPDPTFAANVGNANLPDPRLDLYHAHDGISTLVLTNDNWGGDPQVAAIGASVGAAALTDPASKDAVVLVTLDPGVYSAGVTGVGAGGGIALIEVYVVQ